jgi:putative endonuclease
MSIAKAKGARAVRGDACQAPVLQVPARSRRQAERRGRIAEWLAATLLVAKGYRILARRQRGPYGEIDLIAARGRRIAFVEVKQRRSAEEAAAAVSATQASRLADAAERWLWRNPRYRDFEVGLDAVLLGPRMWPRHIENALNSW